MNHTKGEWERGGQVIYKKDGKSIIATVNYIGMEEEGKANANLIAAAPKLYEALKELVQLVEDMNRGDYNMDSYTLQPAKQALAKAEGREE